MCHGIITALLRSEKIGRKTVVVGEGEPVSPLSGPTFVVVGVQHTDTFFCVLKFSNRYINGSNKRKTGLNRNRSFPSK